MFVSLMMSLLLNAKVSGQRRSLAPSSVLEGDP
jgi:hypothetical protein